MYNSNFQKTFKKKGIMSFLKNPFSKYATLEKVHVSAQPADYLGIPKQIANPESFVAESFVAESLKGQDQTS